MQHMMLAPKLRLDERAKKEKMSAVDKREAMEALRAKAEELLEQVGLSQKADFYPCQLSGGQCQRVAIARALVHDPDGVFLDEPYSGLDPHAVEIFDALIADAREGRTFVMVSHDLAKGFALCTHALVMARGRIVAFDEKANLDFGTFSLLYHDTVGMGVA
jgi:heme exporter protein A